MPKKDGELRLLKSGAVYGPMGREDFERLRSAGKVGLDELVSVHGGPWMTVANFVAAAARVPVHDTSVAPAHDLATGSAEVEDNDPVLRLLTGNRIVAALSRAEVERLRQSGRVDDDDLICALYGPWMRVGDFFARPRAKPPPTLLEEHDDAGTQVETAEVALAQPLSRLIAPIVIPGPSAPQGSAAGSFDPPMGSLLRDEWFVRVRGVHSAPLGKRHVRSLFQAKEIARDNVARHPTWPENAWLPIHSIPQLADAVA